jgi:hypothetical protein
MVTLIALAAGAALAGSAAAPTPPRISGTFVQNEAPRRISRQGRAGRYPMLGPSVQVDPAFGYYKDRSPESIAAEIRANGYRVVHYVVTSADKADPRLVEAFHRQGIGVWCLVFGNGCYTTADLPAGWEAWKMVTRTDLQGKALNDGYTRLCLNNADYRCWKKANMAAILARGGFDGLEIAEPHWPEYPGKESPAYACFCGACKAEFAKRIPGEAGLPDILDAASPRSPERDPGLWRKWLEFRRDTLTGFLDDLVNGPGGLRASSPGVPVCTWTLALAQPDGLRRVLEDSGEDAALVARTVRPDLHGLQTHWPDWIRGDLPPDYVRAYKPFIDPLLAQSPRIPVLIQADIGSQKQNRWDWTWVRRFEAECEKLGARSTTLYEYFIGGYMYSDPPRIAAATLNGNALTLSFTKRLGADAAQASRYKVEGRQPASARVDGSLVILTLDRAAKPGKRLRVTARNIPDDPGRRLYDDKPAAVLEEQSVTVVGR